MLGTVAVAAQLADICHGVDAQLIDVIADRREIRDRPTKQEVSLAARFCCLSAHQLQIARGKQHLITDSELTNSERSAYFSVALAL